MIYRIVKALLKNVILRRTTTPVTSGLNMIVSHRMQVSDDIIFTLKTLDILHKRPLSTIRAWTVFWRLVDRPGQTHKPGRGR